MSRKPPQSQYGFVEATDDNPFEETHAAPPTRSKKAQGNANAPRGGQGQKAQPQTAQPARSSQQQQQPRGSQGRAAPAAFDTEEGETETGGAPTAAKKSVFGDVGSMFSNTFSSITGNKNGETNNTALTPEDDLATREANLKAREAKMIAMEQELAEKDRQLKAKENAGKNWPCRCYPLLYHSISDEIPVVLQPMMKKLYFLVLFTWACVTFNAITCSVIAGEASNNGTDIIWSWLYVPLGVGGSWILWYSQAYAGAKDSSSRKYLMYFCGFFFHFAYIIIIGLGTPSSGAGGLLKMISCFGGGYTVSGIFALVDTAFHGFNFLLSVYLGKKVYSAWSNGGGSEQLKKDKNKLAMASKLGALGV